MKIYTLPTFTDRGTAIKDLIDEMVQVDRAAQHLALTFSADSWIPSPSVDCGGIAAVTFPSNIQKSKSMAIWQQLEVSALPDDAEQTPLFIPNARSETKPILEEKAMNLKESWYISVDGRPLTFHGVHLHFTRKDAAELVGYELSGNDSLDDERLTPLLSPLRFRYVTRYYGALQAIKNLRSIEELPAIPPGTINKLCGIDDRVSIAGLSLVDDTVYIISHNDIPCTLEDATEISIDDYHALVKAQES